MRQYCNVNHQRHGGWLWPAKAMAACGLGLAAASGNDVSCAAKRLIPMLWRRLSSYLAFLILSRRKKAK